MLPLLLGDALLQPNFSSFIVFADRLYWIGEPFDGRGNSLIQKIDGSQIDYSLSHGTPLSDIESIDRLVEREEILKTKEDYVADQLQSKNSYDLEIIGRYTMLRFIVDEIFPRMLAAPMEDRIAAIFSQKSPKTGKEILVEALGDSIISQNKVINIPDYVVQRIEKEVSSEPLSLFTGGKEFSHVASSTDRPSFFYRMMNNVPMLVFGGKIYLCTDAPDESDLGVKIGDSHLGCVKKALAIENFYEQYDTYVSAMLRKEAFLELKDRLSIFNEQAAFSAEYMPLMDLDEFRFRDVGFYRNGDIYYIFKRIPKFARQTTYDENLFVAKEFDSEGYAGDFGIGLRAIQEKIQYLGYSESQGGVTYRGPIKEDAPFRSKVNIIDPVLRSKYGSLRTICHVGGYPHFPMTPDGFIQFLNYATTNFLDSFRQAFKDYHFDQEEQARLLDEGKLLTRQTALDRGFMLTNIHEVKRDA